MFDINSTNTPILNCKCRKVGCSSSTNRTKTPTESGCIGQEVAAEIKDITTSNCDPSASCPSGATDCRATPNPCTLTGSHHCEEIVTQPPGTIELTSAHDALAGITAVGKTEQKACEDDADATWANNACSCSNNKTWEYKDFDNTDISNSCKGGCSCIQEEVCKNTPQRTDSSRGNSIVAKPSWNTSSDVCQCSSQPEREWKYPFPVTTPPPCSGSCECIDTRTEEQQCLALSGSSFINGTCDCNDDKRYAWEMKKDNSCEWHCRCDIDDNHCQTSGWDIFNPSYCNCRCFRNSDLTESELKTRCNNVAGAAWDATNPGKDKCYCTNHRNYEWKKVSLCGYGCSCKSSVKTDCNSKGSDWTYDEDLCMCYCSRGCAPGQTLDRISCTCSNWHDDWL